MLIRLQFMLNCVDLLIRNRICSVALCCLRVWFGGLSSFLRKSFVMDEKEYQKYCVGRRKCNTRDDINGFSDSNWMRWLLFPNLNETSLEKRRGEKTNTTDEKFSGTNLSSKGMSEWVKKSAHTHSYVYMKKLHWNWIRFDIDVKCEIKPVFTSVAQPLFAECVHGVDPPPQFVHATISFGPPASRFFSPYGCCCCCCMCDGGENITTINK